MNEGGKSFAQAPRHMHEKDPLIPSHTTEEGFEVDNDLRGSFAVKAC